MLAVLSLSLLALSSAAESVTSSFPNSQDGAWQIGQPIGHDAFCRKRMSRPRTKDLEGRGLSLERLSLERLALL